ncbi:helix-turn-helix domain-containing protein [Actinacidiphila acidipaludis]|uniref:Helix-turn-helix domain-containing protein n=1 Tax=Actinacidiphila acidipaludis TaxID=2873382 RepID=A0ABS7QHU3_9ACTN|nr:helix-turn-helix transcriptional regulator [Streptomyces acidipaludis]MBY8882715.1 helix-turn-helix domain-containing protein [Streptomyces acidipaludis]
MSPHRSQLPLPEPDPTGPDAVEQFDIAELGRMLKDQRGSLSLRQAAAEAGVSFSTFTRVEAGAQPDLATFTRLCAWLQVPASRFFTPGVTREISPLDQAITHLHADPRLTGDAASKITSVLRDLYQALAQETAPAKPALACHLRAAPMLRPGVPQRLADLLTDMHTGLERLAEAGDL